MKVQVINLSNNPLPKYETENAAGLDVRSDFSRINSKEALIIFGSFELLLQQDGFTNTMLRLDPGSRALIPTGLKVGIPEGYEIQVRPRSGLALKKGLTVLNTPGTIDARLQ